MSPKFVPLKEAAAGAGKTEKLIRLYCARGLLWTRRLAGIGRWEVAVDASGYPLPASAKGGAGC
jgi:hypothetical protein